MQQDYNFFNSKFIDDSSDPIVLSCPICNCQMTSIGELIPQSTKNVVIKINTACKHKSFYLCLIESETEVQLFAANPKPDYYEYIKSEEWIVKATDAKERADWRCQVCNKEASESITLDAHHRTYERLGNERPEDITVLCRECHDLYEKNRKMKKNGSK